MYWPLAWLSALQAFLRIQFNWRRQRTMAEQFIAQARLLRLLALLNLLLSGHKFTIKQIADRLETSQRSTYRYINLLESVGICIDKDWANRFFLAQDSCPVCNNKKIERV